MSKTILLFSKKRLITRIVNIMSNHFLVEFIIGI